MMAKKQSLYPPAPLHFQRNFNKLIVGWLRDEVRLSEHQPAQVFSLVRTTYDALVQGLLKTGRTKAGAHRELLTGLTAMLMGIDVGGLLAARLSPDLINASGFRTTLAQGAAKNSGENFVNIIVYALALVLEDQDEVLVDKGAPPPIQDALRLFRNVSLQSGQRNLEIPIECDFTIFSRTDPMNAIIVSAKTRLKEVFHVGTMWKLLFDCIGDEYCKQKWGLSSGPPPSNITYCFATADMIPKGGNKTQGPDIERSSPRNLIMMDASFFDYVFVSKAGIPHVSETLTTNVQPKEALFYSLGCLLDLIGQKFRLELKY